MINREYFEFLKFWQEPYKNNLLFCIKTNCNEWLIARNYVFQVVDIKGNIDSYAPIIVKDGNDNIFTIYAYIDRNISIGNKIIVPGAFKTYTNGEVYLQVCVGYTTLDDIMDELYLPLTSGKFPIDEYVVNSTTYEIPSKCNDTSRGRFIITNNKGLPDEFWEQYKSAKSAKPQNETVNDYIDNLALLNYKAEYSLDEIEIPELENNKTENYQSLESRLSKIYIMSKDMKNILFKTNALLASAKYKALGMSAIEFRKLENQKIFDLLEKEGLTKDKVSFARKERGGIRAHILNSEKDDFVLVKARFAEINLDDHQDKNNLRYLKDGSIIELKDDKWWFVNEL